MIQQRPGDLLEIEYDGGVYYVVVLTKIVLFGGNIVFAYHGDGTRRELDDLLRDRRGFNICTDLLLPKREGVVTRLHRFAEVSEFWLSPYVKSTHPLPPGQRAKIWFISRVDDLENVIERVSRLERRYRDAMDDGCHSFDLTAQKIVARYTPDQHPNL